MIRSLLLLVLIPLLCHSASGQNNVYSLPDTIHVTYITLGYIRSNEYIRKRTPIEISYIRMNDSITLVTRTFIDPDRETFYEDFEIATVLFDSYVEDLKRIDTKQVAKSDNLIICSGFSYSLEFGNDNITMKANTTSADSNTSARGLVQYLATFRKIFELKAPGIK